MECNETKIWNVYAKKICPCVRVFANFHAIEVKFSNIKYAFKSAVKESHCVVGYSPVF